MGVTQRYEIQCHLNIFVKENFGSVSKLDTSFYPMDQCLSLVMYRSMIMHWHTHMDQEKVLGLISVLGFEYRNLIISVQMTRTIDIDEE